MSSARKTQLAALAVLGIVAVLVSYMVGSSDSAGHQVSATVQAAPNVLVNTQIKIAGESVGRVTSLEADDGGRAARVNFEITNNDYWPLPVDSKLELRFGGTVSFSSRYFALTRGTDTETLPEGGEFTNVKLPVEVDTLISDFDPKTRNSIKGFIGANAAVFDNGAEDLNGALAKTGPLTNNAADVFEQLVSNRERLRTLVDSTSSVVDAIDRADPDVGVLIQGFADTSVAINSEATNLQTTLERFPAALRQTRTTLANAAVTLREAGVLTDRIAPGVEELRRITTPLDDVLGQLRLATPTAVRTVDLLRVAAPPVTQLFNVGYHQTDRLISVGNQADTELNCIRPYAPEITLLGETWGDWISYVDSKDHYVRANLQAFLPTGGNNSQMSPAEAAATFPGLEYGFPRPPGGLADQPWFLPECGLGPDIVDPAQDKETTFQGQPPPSSAAAGSAG